MKSKGMTALELLLVVVIIGIIALIAINSLGKSTVNWTLRGEVNNLASLIYQAKSLAVKSERVVRIRFDNPSDVKQYWLEEKDPSTNTYNPVLDHPGEISPQAKVYLTPPFQNIYFFPDGRIMVESGSTYTLSLVEIYVSLSDDTNHYIKIRLYPLGAMETEKHFVY